MRPAEALNVTSSQLRELRVWQAARLASTYGDLLHDPECVDAVKFFLTDLYGPEEHTRRDQDLGRAWSILSRTLPRAALGLLERAIELQTLTAQLDEAMAQQLAAGPVTQESYAAAYRAVGRPEARRRQIELVLTIATELERVVRHAWVGFALRAARVPAHAAGFGALQDFLERGFAAFRRMKDAQPMLNAIRERETRLCAALLAGGPAPFAAQAAGSAPP
jgi:hypothetical protein